MSRPPPCSPKSPARSGGGFSSRVSRDCNTRAAIETAFAPLRATLSACEFSTIEQGQSTPFYDLA